MSSTQENSQTPNLKELINSIPEELLHPKIMALLKEQAEKDLDVTVEAENEKITEIAENVKTIMKQMEYVDLLEKRNKILHDEVQKYQSGLKRELVIPVLKQVIREYDRASELLEHFSAEAKKEQKEEAEKEGQKGDLIAEMLNAFGIIPLCLLDLLAENDVEPIEVKENDKRKQGEHRIINVVETTDEACHDTVAKCVHRGFVDRLTGRSLRPAEVEIFKYSNINQ